MACHEKKKLKKFLFGLKDRLTHLYVTNDIYGESDQIRLLSENTDKFIISSFGNKELLDHKCKHCDEWENVRWREEWWD